MSSENKKVPPSRSSVFNKWFTVFIALIVIAALAFLVMIIGARIYYHAVTAKAMTVITLEAMS